MRRLGNESGQTLVMVALSMAVLLGFAAFATDVGVLLNAKRKAQSAADSAAIAAAWGSTQNTGTVAAGTAAATANGYTAGTDADGYATTVDIEPTPIDGHFSGQAGYVEAIITRQVPTFFMHMFGKDSATVAARAVATNKGSSTGCLTTVKGTGTTLQFQGSFHVSAPGCVVSVQSSDADALQFTGGAGSLTAAAVNVVGGDGGQTGDSTPTPTTGAAYTGDPMAGQLTAPSYGPSGTTACTAQSSIGTTGSQTYIPNPTGTVCYSSTGDINLTNVNLAPGTYIFNNPTGSLILNGAINGPAVANSTSADPSVAVDTTSGVGVTLYLLGGMDENTGTVINLTAPKSGNYSDVLLWGAGTYTGSKGLCPTGKGNRAPGLIQLNIGNSSGNFTGMIYAPTSELLFQDSGSDSDGPDFTTNIVVGTMCDETADINITSYSQAEGSGRFPRISLVE